MVVALYGSHAGKRCLFELIRILLMVRSCCIRSPVGGTTEILFLHASIFSRNGIEMTHFNDVYLTTARPSVFIDIVTHHPVSWPETIGCFRELDFCLHDTMLEGCLLVRVDTARGKVLAFIVLALGCQHQVAIFYADVFTAVVL